MREKPEETNSAYFLTFAKSYTTKTGFSVYTTLNKAAVWSNYLYFLLLPALIT